MAQMVPNVGIDVSKERLDVAVLPAGPQFNVSNDTAGWRELCRRLKPLEVRAIGIEPSGGYGSSPRRRDCWQKMIGWTHR